MIIRTLRLQRGWSQEQLAEISGVSSRTIQRIESGNKASLESLKCLAAVFETTFDELQEDEPMTTDNKTTHEGLSEEDRAALKYAHYLKQYDSAHDDIDNEHAGMSPQERNIVKEVRLLKKFYTSATAYVIIVLFLLMINLMTNPGNLWVLWPALGMGIGLAFQALRTFGFSNLGDDWERRQVEERLKKL